MKNTIAMISLSLISILGFGQTKPGNRDLSTRYTDLKDALVKGDEKLASEKALEFVKGLEAFQAADANKKNEQQISILKKKLTTDGHQIAQARSISAQRETFMPLSTNFFDLSKLTKTSETPLYQFYCPMKKAIWLSTDKAVKNPYYGNQMLTCGSLQETVE